MSQPDEDFAETPGWGFLSLLIPKWFSDKYRYWQCVGSILLVLATNHSKTLQRPFNTAFVQYFGKISYAIYLVHGPVLHVVGYTIEPWAWSITGHETKGQYIAGFILGSILVVPATVWAADLFWRAFDAPTVRFARWLENKCNASDL
jgi:peptidoglycan/LPS O-acetylase OafA/YrhL